MTLQDATRRAPAVVRPDEQRPLGDVRSRVAAGFGQWSRSPVLDFYGLIVVGFLLIGTGLVMVLSSSSVTAIDAGHSPFSEFLKQSAFAAAGLLVLIIAALVPPRVYKGLAPVLLGLGLLLQLAVHIPGLGWEAGGNRNWIRIGSFTMQPSELLKLALAVWLGAALARKRPLLHRLRHLFLPVVPVVILALGLVVWGRDLGTMMVMAILVAGALWVSGVPKRWFLAGAAGGAVVVALLAIASPNRMTRITNWLHGTCPEDSCYQSEQGLMGMAEGGWWGIGLGESRQKWGRLPAAQDDYIFAIIGEELGLLGTLSVLAMFAVLAWILLRMIGRAEDVFIQIAIGGIAAWLLGQALVNMSVVTGLLPVLGVPLPFISAGGSALIASMLALGVLISFARHEPGARDAISANVRSVRRSLAVIPASREEAGAAAPRRSRRRTAASRRASSSTASRRASGSTSSRRASGAAASRRVSGSGAPAATQKTRADARRAPRTSRTTREAPTRGRSAR